MIEHDTYKHFLEIASMNPSPLDATSYWYLRFTEMHKIYFRLHPEGFDSPLRYLNYDPCTLASRAKFAQKFFVYFHEVEPVYLSDSVYNWSTQPRNVISDGHFGIALAISFSSPQLKPPNTDHNSSQYVWCGFDFAEIFPNQQTSNSDPQPALSLNLVQFQTGWVGNAYSMNQHLGFVDYQTLLFHTLENLGLALSEAGTQHLHYISVQNAWKYDHRKARDNIGPIRNIDEQILHIQAQRVQWAKHMGCNMPALICHAPGDSKSAHAKPISEIQRQRARDPMVDTLQQLLKNTR